MDKQAQVRRRVLNILRGHEAARIRFTVPVGSATITINTHTFQDVARAIEADDIAIDVDTPMPAGVGAQYLDDVDTLQIPPIFGREQEGELLHECTHAWFDLKSTSIPALDEEATAYVVSSLYFRVSGLTSTRWTNNPHPKAGVVANGLLKQYQAGTPGVPAVDPGAWASLKTAIQGDPVYVGGPAATGGSYTHDGVTFQKNAKEFVKKVNAFLGR